MDGTCRTFDTTPPALVALARCRRTRASLAEMAERLWLWYDRARSRRVLLGMDDRMLQDIGVDRASAQIEGSRPFWR